MKVTVCINENKIVIPCGDGDLSIRQLAELAIIRYRKTALSKGATPENIAISSLRLARDGGMLDWDDKVNDVLDDRDMLIAQHGSPDPERYNQKSLALPNSPLNRHSYVTPGDIITADLTTSTSSHLPQTLKPMTRLPLLSNNYVPLSFGSSGLSPDYYNIRHNSIPCSDHDIHRYFDLFDTGTNALHESLDDILDLNHPNRRLHNHNSVNIDYEKWPLPPFPALSTLQSSADATIIPKNITLQLHDTDGDDLTWDNSPNDCYEEDYPRLRPDYIVKHLTNNQGKSIENSVPSRQVLQWLESQECGSVSSNGGGGIGGGGGSSGGVGTSSYEACSDIKESESTNIAAIVLDDRNNNRIHASYSSASSGNDHNRLRENPPTTDLIGLRQSEDSIIVRITNIKPGENLGIQIIPAYIQDKVSINNVVDIESKCIHGIEVHSILPKGRVAKEKQLNKGDKIIQINDVNLFGLPYERGESIFREALQKSECKLRIIPYKYPAVSPISIQISKSNPPPPPRRSPNTALSVTKSNSDNSDRGPIISAIQHNCKSPIPTIPSTMRTTCSKLNPAPPPPIQQKPVASWTSGFGSMLHTPASSTSSVSAVEKKKLEQIINSVNGIKTELIELTKIGSGFGFSITGIDNQPANIPTAIYVRHILPDGAAIRDGRLKSDDRILEIDGLLLDGMSQSEVISLLREKPSGSRVKLLVERNELKKHSPCSASHDSLMTSLSEMDEDGSTLSKNKKNVTKLHFDIPLNDSSCPGGKTSLGISVKVEPNWDKANITPLSSREDIAASNIMLVKTVIENGAAYRHGKLLVGDQLLEVNGVPLSGLSSEDALSKLKSLIKEAQDSEEGIVSVVITRKTNIARSSSLNTLNSMTESSIAISYKPIFDRNRNMSYKINNPRNITAQFSQQEDPDPEVLPNRSVSDLPDYNFPKLSIKSCNRTSLLPPTPDHNNRDGSPTDKSSRSKPVPPPPPLARRLKNIENNSNNSETTTNIEHSYASYSTNQIGKSTYQSDEFLPKNIDGLQCSSNTNTLCRNKETSQLMMRARNTRSNCSYTPTKEILHIDDIDWDKMELIPFDNCQLNAKLTNPMHKASISQPVINQDLHSKRIHDTGVHKRKAFKKFSIGQIFRFKHSHYSKPSNSVGSSPINIRKHKDSDILKDPRQPGNAIPTSTSSYSLKSSEQADETEFPYAELDFSHNPVVTQSPETTSLLLKTINNLKTVTATKNPLLPLPEESFKLLPTPSSEDESDSYEDFVDMQTTFPEHVSAVQRITAAMPKQPPNRFVYEDAEELFQSLQANVSLYHDINLSPTVFSPLSNINVSPFRKETPTNSKDLYQNIMSDLSNNPRVKPLTSIKHPESSREPTLVRDSDNPPMVRSTAPRDLYFNWPILPK